MEICLISGDDCWSFGFSYNWREIDTGAGVSSDRYVELNEWLLLRKVLATDFLVGENREFTEPEATAVK